MASGEPFSAANPAIRLFLMTNTFETGGSERQFVELTQNLRKQTFQIHLGCLDRNGPLGEQLEGVAEFPLGGSLTGRKSMQARLALRRHLRQLKIEVAHSFDFYTNLTLIPAARLAGVPVIVGSHRQLGDLLTAAKFRAQTAVFRWCDAVTCNSQTAADRLADAGLSRKKLFVVGNSVDFAAFESVKAAVPRCGALRVGMVARMNAGYKNHAEFLRIAAKLIASVPNVEFLLAGDGPRRAGLEQQAAALGLRGRVTFLGDRRDVPAVLASLDVAVLTSESESLSNAILESMAAGLPVVAYNVGGNAELVNDRRGSLIAPNDEIAFVEAVRRLLGDPLLRQQQGENGRKFVEQNYSGGQVCGLYEKLYRRLLVEKLQRTDA